MGFQWKNAVIRKQAFVITALFYFFGLTSCDAISTRGTATSCPAKTAQILVYEGAMSRVCGCSEASGVFTTSGSLTCTVAFDTAVYFYFTNIANPHQIIVTNFGASGQIDANTSIKTWATKLNQIGTFSFQDTFNGLGGNFVVTP